MTRLQLRIRHAGRQSDLPFVDTPIVLRLDTSYTPNVAVPPASGSEHESWLRSPFPCRFRDRSGVGAHQAQLAAEVGPVAVEEKTGRRGVLGAAADERDSVLVKDAEVADQRLQPPPVASGRDNCIRLNTGAIGKQHIRAVEASNRGNDLD